MPKSLRWFLDAFFRQNRADLLRFVEQRGRAHDAEDCVQDAFLKFSQHGDPQGLEHPKAYLYAIASNLAISHHRKDEVRDRYHEPDKVVELDELPDATPGPESLVAATDEVESLMAALAELPEIYGHAFLLNRLENYSHKQVAHALGISQSTAQRYIFRAWQHCRERLQR